MRLPPAPRYSPAAPVRSVGPADQTGAPPVGTAAAADWTTVAPDPRVLALVPTAPAPVPTALALVLTALPLAPTAAAPLPTAARCTPRQAGTRTAPWSSVLASTPVTPTWTRRVRIPQPVPQLPRRPVLPRLFLSTLLPTEHQELPPVRRGPPSSPRLPRSWEHPRRMPPRAELAADVLGRLDLRFRPASLEREEGSAAAQQRERPAIELLQSRHRSDSDRIADQVAVLILRSPAPDDDVLESQSLSHLAQPVRTPLHRLQQHDLGGGNIAATTIPGSPAPLPRSMIRPSVGRNGTTAAEFSRCRSHSRENSRGPTSPRSSPWSTSRSWKL